MVITHCPVSKDTETKDTFCCLSAIDARRGLYYEIDWDHLHDKALEVPDFCIEEICSFRCRLALSAGIGDQDASVEQ